MLAERAKARDVRRNAAPPSVAGNVRQKFKKRPLEIIVILLYSNVIFGHFHAAGVAASCMAWRLAKEYSSFSKRRTKIDR